MVQLIMFDFRVGFETLPIEPAEMVIRLSRLGKKFVFQKEKGEKTGYLHWQGRVSLWKRTTLKNAKKLFLDQLAITKDYYFRSTAENARNSGNGFNYVMKAQTRLAGPWTEKDKVPYIPRQYRKTLRPWQQTVINSASIFDERSIDVIVDINGGIGKSICMGIAKLRYGWEIVNPFDEGRRIIENTCSMLVQRDNKTPNFIMDVPRALDNNKKAAVFAALEQLKSGIVSDSRNNSKEFAYDTPRIWVFTNNNIPTSYFSKDRWRFWKIDENQELVPF